MFVQFFLLYLLWTHGLTIVTEQESATAAQYPDKTFIAKPKKLGNMINIEFAMLISIIVVYVLIGLSLLEHMNVIATMREYFGLMR
jgi:hypothetical protein